MSDDSNFPVLLNFKYSDWPYWNSDMVHQEKKLHLNSCNHRWLFNNCFLFHKFVSWTSTWLYCINKVTNSTVIILMTIVCLLQSLWYGNTILFCLGPRICELTSKNQGSTGQPCKSKASDSAIASTVTSARQQG